MEEKDYIGQLYQKAKTDFGYNKDEDYFRDKITNDEQYRKDFHGKLVNDYGYKVTDYDEFVGKLGIAGSVVEEPAGQEPVAKAIDIMPDEEVPQQYRSVYSKLPQSLKQSLTPAMRKRGEMMATPEGRATWAAEMREASKEMPKQARRVMEQEADDIDAYDDGGLFDAKQMEAANATAMNKSVYDDMVFTDADNAVIDKIESDNRSRNEAVKMQQRQVRKVDGMAVSLGLPTSYDNVADINTSVRTMFDQTEDGKDINKRIQDEMKVAQFEVMDALKNSEDEEVKEVASFYTDLEAIRTEGDEIERLSAELKEHKAALGKDATKDEVDAYNAEAKALKERFDTYNARAKRYEELEKSGAVERFNELFDATIKNDTYLNGLYEEYDKKLNAMFGGWMEEKAMPMKREIAKESWDILSDEINKRITEVNKSFYGGEKGLSPTAALIATSNVFGTSDAVLTSASPATGDLSLARDYLNKSKKLIDAYNKGNAVSLTKGFVDPLTDTDFYTFGLAQVAKGFMSKDVMDKLGKDLSGYESLTEDEKLLVDAIEQYYITQQLFQPNGWYKAGQVTAEAIPFIVAMGGSGAVGKGIGEALGNSSKAWVKTLAKAFPEAEGRVALSNIGRSAERITAKQFFTSSLPKAVARTATEGAVYAGTTGLPNTVATAIDYMMPELSVDVDVENRDIVATGMKKSEETWASALAKGFAMQAIEGSSEAFSTYALEPATKYLGGRIMASLGKNGERYFQNIARTTFGNSGIMGQASRHLSGPLFEYTEEMFGGFLRCISGLSDWDQEFNGKNLAETAFGLAPMEAVFLVMGGGNMAMHHRRMGQARTLLEQHSPESIGLYERLSGMSSYEGQDLLDREVISVMQQVEQMKAAGTFDETAQKALASRMNMALTMKEQLYMDEAAATMRDETMRYAYETYTSNLNEQSGNLVIADYTDKDGNTKSVFVIGERDGKTIVSDGKDTFVADGKVNIREEYTPDQLDDNIIESVGEQFNAGLPQVTPTVGETYAFVGGDMKIENVDEDGFITATVNGRQVELSRREFREMYGDSEKAMAYAQGVVEAQHGSGEGDARLLATSDNAADHAARGALVRQTRRNLARIVGERRMEELESMNDAQLARAYAEADGQTKTAMAMWMRFGGRYSDTYRKAMGQRGMNTILDFRGMLGVGRYGNGYVTVASYNGGLVVVNDNDGQQATITDLEGNKSIVDAKQLSDMQEADADSFASQATVGQRSAIASLEQAYDGLVFGNGEHKIASNEDGRGNTAVVVSENADGTITYATEFNIDQNTGEVHHEGRSEKTVTREAFRDMIESTAAEDMRKKMAQQQQEQKKEDIGELKDGQRVTLLDGSRVRSGEYSQNAGRNFVRFDDGTVKMFNDMGELKQAIADASSPEMKANMLIEEYQAKFAEAKTSEAKAAVIQEYLDKIKSDDNVVVLMQSNMLEALKARGVGEEQLNNIADALHITQTTGQVFRGVFVPGVGVVINADGIASIDDTRSVYVHERQHGFTNNDLSLRKNNSLLAKVIAAAGRFELDSIVMRMSNSSFYLGKSHRTLADEFISHAMEIAYRSDDVESALREAGVTNEKLISIIKQLDDEQRTDQRLSQSRLTAPVNGSEQGDNRNDVEDSAGEPGEVGGQGPRPAEGGDSQAPGGEVEEQPEEEKKEEPQPQPKTREQMVAEEVSYVLQGNDKYLDNNLREARRKKKAADKRQPQSTDKKKYEQQKEQIKEQQDKAKDTLAFWEDVKAAVDAAKSENQARLDEAEEALSQLDNALNPIAQVETTHKFDKEPANAEEAAAQFLVGFVPASSRINEDSLMQETGWGREEVKRFRPATTPNGGVSVQQAGEALYAEYEGEGHEHGWFGDDADAKNVLINAMQETGSYGNLARYINDRRSQAEQDMAYALENALNDGAVQLGYENAQDMHDKRMEEARNLLESLKDENGMLFEESLQQFNDKVNELGFMWQEEQANSEIPEELRPIEGEAPFSVMFSVAGLVTNEQGEIDYDRVTNLAENITNDGAGVLRMGNEGTRLGGLSRIPQVYQGTSGVPAAAAAIIARASYQKIGGERSAEGRMAQTPQAVSFRVDTRKAIESWAKDQGYWFDEPRLTDGFTEIKGGTESRVFLNGDSTKVRKLTSYTAAYGDYMQRLMENVEIFNATFPDAAYDVIGFGKDNNGNLAAVVEQPYIEGDTADKVFRNWDEQFDFVSNYMRQLGFTPVDNDGWYTNGEVYVDDVKNANVVIDSNGNPHVIDVVTSLDTRAYREPFVLYSVVTPQQDADYMDAVNRGDMETAQRMVMEAAKAAMPNTKVVDENGNPKVVYHQTNSTIFVNKETGQEWEKLDWAEKEEWESRDDWNEYWEEKDFNTFDESRARRSVEIPGFFFAPEYDEYHGYGERTIEAFLNIQNPAINPDYTGLGLTDNAGAEIRDRLIAKGYDGIINTEGGEVYEYIAFKPSQIKSADPVTYDDQGNVIPLSQRFNESNDDIRYSVASPESQAIFDKAKEIFGTTTDIREAGYVLPDGTMLDFSGRHGLNKGDDDSFLRGERTSDHRDIRQIEYEKDGNTPSGVNTDMPDFIRRGAIRIDDGAGVINLYVKPTKEQRWPLRRLIERNDGDVQVDFGDGWDSDHYVEYEGAKPSRVLADIDRYFDEGIKPEGNTMFSIVGQVINRNGDINYEELDNIIRGQRNELAGLLRIPEEAIGRAVETPAIAAEAIARGVRQANLAKVWGEDRAREHTRELIKQWARQSGHWYDETRLTDGATEGRGGTESRVFITNNGETVRKLTSPVFSKGDVEPYIESLHLFGNVFGESAYEIKGFGENEDGELCVVVEQPYIQGVRLSDSGITKSIDKIRGFMEGLGFKNVGVSMFENDKYRVEDVNRTNVIVDANGDFHIIDAYVSLADESLYKEEPRFSVANRNQAIFVSNAARAVEGIRQEKATPEQWLKMIEKQGGLKEAEDKWLGLSQWLQSQDKKTLTKQEVLDFINENAIKIEETNYSDIDSYSGEARQKFNELQKEFEELMQEEIKDSQAQSDLEAATKTFEEYGNMLYDKYGASFLAECTDEEREMFSKLSDAEIDAKRRVREREAVGLFDQIAFNKMVEKYGDDFGIAFNFRYGGYGNPSELFIDDSDAAAYFLTGEKPINSTRLQYTTEGLDNKREIALTVPTIEPWNESDEIHFGDAGEGRAVAWIRFGETTDDDGNRVLVIDEIQSKRHQEGREKGYKKQIPEDAQEKIRYEKAHEEWVNYLNELRKKYGVADVSHAMTEDEDKRSKELFKKESDAALEYHQYLSKNRLGNFDPGVPSAPFEKNWMELAMKRMLRLAAEEGYDKVAWTTGEQQAERYDLSKQVDAISYIKNEDGTYEVHVTADGDSMLLEHSRHTPAERLSDLLGKEIAQKIINGEGEQHPNKYLPDKILTGVDLKVGGEGMKGFYDKMLPSFMNKYGKQWGVKVGEVTMPNLEEGYQTMHSVDVTDAMKESVMEGQPMFSFIGRKGAQQLDFADREMTRLNDRTKAMEMDRKGIDPKTIKLATGWEKGRDKEWRYEIPDYYKAGEQADKMVEERKKKLAELRKKENEAYRKYYYQSAIIPIRLDDRYTEEEKAKYREMRKRRDAYWKEYQEAGRERFALEQQEVYSTTLEDMLGEGSQLLTAYPQLKGIKVEIKDLHDPNLQGDYDDTTKTIRLNATVGSSRYNNIIAHEVQHAIQSIEGFAKGGNPSRAGQMAQDVVANSYAYQYMRDAKTVAESTGITDELKIWELVKEMYKQLGSDATSIYPLDARTMGYKLFLHPEKYDIDRYKKAFDTWRDGRMNGEDFWDSYTEEQRFQLYRSLAGEVESRNTSRRLGMTEEERRASLARDTEDVERRNQLVSMNGASLFSVAGRPMTMKEATTQELLKLAAENRDDARLQDDATRAATETLAELMLAMRNARKISKRRRSKMEGAVDDIAKAQARYDAEVADRVTNLATMLLRYGNLDGLSRGEVARLLAAVKNSMDGNVMEQAEKIVDVLLNHQLKQAAAILDKQLKTKASKVNESGVREQGSLDIEGQRILEAAREGISLDYDEWVKRLGDVQDKLTSPIETQRLNAELDYQGLTLAQQYRWKIATSEQQEKSLERELREQQEKIYDFTVEEKDGKKVYRKKLKPEYKGKLDAEHQATKDMVLQTEIEIEDSIRALQMDRADAYNRLSADLARVIARGREAAKAFRDQQLQRIEDIHHNANSDLNGVPADEHFQPNRWWRFRGNAFFNFLFMPQQNFDEMLRFFAPDSADGKGYLFNRFMKMQQTARDSEWASLMADNQQLDSKVSEVLGGKMKWQDLYAIERKLPTIEVEFMDDGEMKPHTLTQGNALYIYMVNKMSDGAMKLRAMGITQEKVDEITEQIDPRFIEIADWIQEQFLPKTRDRFNEVHMRLYGAPMAAIENYFPLKVLHEQAEELGKEDEIQMMSSTPGAIKERTRNINPLDVTRTDAFSLVVEHINEMEHWEAYAEMIRDLNTLLSYKRFRNRVNNMSSARFGKGKDLFANFKKTCEAVTGTLKQKTGKADKAMLNIAKGVTASKINFRLYTAMKQIASMPAFWADANIAELAKGFFGFNPVAQAKAWKWAIEELPGFAKRWQSRFSGNEMLDENKSDWDLWRNSFIENASRIGMSPNAFVDAVTVAMGSRMVYESKLKKYKKQGYDDATAKDKALQDAWLVYNESQQSNDPAFLSIMQAERSWLGSALSLFRNASFGYGRRFYRSLANLKKLGPENRKAMIEYMTKQGVRDGLTEEQAYKAAKKAANRLLAKNLWDAAVFGYVVQFAWNLMPMLPYLIGGDDDDKKREMAEDVALHSLAGPVEGMPAGNIVSSVYNDMLQGGNWTDYDYHLMPLINDINGIRKKYGTDKVAAINDMMMILMGTFTGVDPRGLTDIGVAIWDACNGDPETSKEVALLIMRITQIPQSQIDQLYLDEVGLTAGEARRLPADELAKRYAAYKMRKNAPLTSWAYDEDMEDKVLKRYEKKFYRMMDERIEAMSDEALESVFNESDDPAVRKTIGKKVAAEMGEEDTEGQTPSKSWLPETRQSAIAYQNERTYDDMKEDVALRHAIKEAEASGDTERKASLEEEKRELDNLRHQLNGDSEHDAPILREYRNGRSAVIRLYNINVD